MTPVLLAAVALVIVGCAPAVQYALVEPGRVPIGEAYTVEPQLAWTSTARGKVVSWTVDGFVLHNLRFFTSIADGEPLFPEGEKADQPRPRFRATMTETEVAEFVVDSLYGGRPSPRELRPADFGGAPGFRFGLDYVTGDGLRRQALVAGAVIARKLHLIVYDGTALHHFPRYRPEVERLLSSIRLR